MRHCFLGKMAASILVLLALWPLVALAQSEVPRLPLQLERTFGYGSGIHIQGVFTLSVPEQDGLERVDFLIDGQVVQRVAGPPFSFRFNTADYKPGPHTLSAVGHTATGETLASAPYRREFLTAAQAWQATRAVLVPLLAFVGLAVALSALVPVLLARRQGARQGSYGLAGGAVCPRCARPYARPFLAPNLLVGKLARCPHCGRWAVVGRASPQALQAAEARWEAEARPAAEAPGSGPLAADSPDRLRRALDESRYEDSP